MSPEELRALAYDGAKQGVSLQHVVSGEAYFSLLAVLSKLLACKELFS